MWLYLSILSGQKETVIVPGSVLIIHCWLLTGLCLNAKWKRVSTVTVTNAYASSTTAILNDPYTSCKSQHTHSRLHPSPIQTILNVFTLPHCVSIKRGKRERFFVFFLLLFLSTYSVFTLSYHLMKATNRLLPV